MYLRKHLSHAILVRIASMVISWICSYHLVLINPLPTVGDLSAWEFTFPFLPMKDQIPFLARSNVGRQSKGLTAWNLLVHGRFLECKHLSDDGNRTTVSHKNLELVKISDRRTFITVDHLLRLFDELLINWSRTLAEPTVAELIRRVTDNNVELHVKDPLGMIGMNEFVSVTFQPATTVILVSFSTAVHAFVACPHVFNGLIMNVSIWRIERVINGVFAVRLLRAV